MRRVKVDENLYYALTEGGKVGSNEQVNFQKITKNRIRRFIKASWRYMK